MPINVTGNTPSALSSIYVGNPNQQNNFGDLAGLQKFTKNFQTTAGLAAGAKGLTREQVMKAGGFTGLEGLNIDFQTKDGLAIWESIAGADGLLSAREQASALLLLDANGTNTADGSLKKDEATAGFKRLIANSKKQNGIAQAWLNQNQVAKNVGLDTVAGFEENATEVTTAKNRVNGGFWGSVDPKVGNPTTPTPTPNPNPGGIDIAALIKLITDYLAGKK
jgi:hypothetical protein